MRKRSHSPILLFLLCLNLAQAVTVRALTLEEITALQGQLTKATAELKVLAGNPDAGFRTKIDQALGDLNKASNALAGATKITEGSEEIAGDQIKNYLATARAAINSAVNHLDDAGEAAKKDHTKNAVIKVTETLTKTNESIGRMILAEKKITADPSKPPAEETAEGLMDGLTPYFVPALIAIGGLLTFGLLLYLVLSIAKLRQLTSEHFSSALPKTFSGLKAKHDELGRQVEASLAVSKDNNQRLVDVHVELRQMSRVLQQTSLANSRQANGLSNHFQPAAPPVSDEPVFPMAADEFLRKMHGKSLVVRRDFQNDMLVSDPDGKGELVLIRDSQVADEIQPLFLVPSVAQFQMRQEYYNFYEKYYDCVNPESGAVWILDPAVVEKVAGGWQLREKGRLEIR